jgi:hypothetical protein
MRCQCVGANVSPMERMLSPVVMLFKPVMLSHRMIVGLLKNRHSHSNTCDSAKARVSSDEVDMSDDVKNWLKHIRPPDEIEITDFEAVLTLVRAQRRSLRPSLVKARRQWMNSRIGLDKGAVRLVPGVHR